jgi:tetratricopeptide (TPR) repeat protein
MIKQPSHDVYDTIGCVYFALGDYSKAVPAFESAMKLFNEDKSLTDFTWFASEDTKRKAGKIRVHLQSLYARRLEAARANLASVQAGKAADLAAMLPLPRDLGQPLPVPAIPSPTTELPPSTKADQLTEKSLP